LCWNKDLKFCFCVDVEASCLEPGSHCSTTLDDAAISPQSALETDESNHNVHDAEDFVWIDAAGRRVYFSAGEEEIDPLAESLARALRSATRDRMWPGQDEPPLHNKCDNDDGDDDDPFNCTGTFQ
jgi:hypothetical protein